MTKALDNLHDLNTQMNGLQSLHQYKQGHYKNYNLPNSIKIYLGFGLMNLWNIGFIVQQQVSPA